MRGHRGTKASDNESLSPSDTSSLGIRGAIGTDAEEPGVESIESGAERVRHVGCRDFVQCRGDVPGLPGKLLQEVRIPVRAGQHPFDRVIPPGDSFGHRRGRRRRVRPVQAVDGVEVEEPLRVGPGVAQPARNGRQAGSGHQQGEAVLSHAVEGDDQGFEMLALQKLHFIHGEQHTGAASSVSRSV